MRREYLGDGLYVEFDGWQYRLFTQRENGVHEVYLEPAVVNRFEAFMQLAQPRTPRNGEPGTPEHVREAMDKLKISGEGE